MTTSRPPSVLLTGAAGFLGRHVLSQLAGCGYGVVATISSRSLPEHMAVSCVKVLRGDIANESFLREAISGVDLVCHAAAYVPANHSDMSEAERCLDVNTLATLKLGELALASDVQRFVYVGAGNVYVPSDQPVREDHPQYPSDRGAYYLASKLMGEIYLDHLRRRGLPLVSLRPSNIYGPGMRAGSVVQRFIDQALAGLPLDVHHGGIPEVDHVYASDVAWCVRAAFEGGELGAYNVGSGRSWSLLELAETVSEVYGATAGIRVWPPERSVPASLPAFAIEKAHAAWGYSPLSLPDGLQRLRTLGSGGCPKRGGIG